jgi:hypothetical protein
VRRLLTLTLAILVLPQAARAAESSLRPQLDLETGILWASRNDIGVPGDTGSRFSAAGGAFSTHAALFGRVQAGLHLGRHRIAATFAPIRLQGNGSGGATIRFRGQGFTADGGASLHYKFDTYRLTYRYALVDRPGLGLEAGVTALVRDAEIRLSEAGHATTERNVGFVPLLSFRLAVGLTGPIWLAIDGDALAARQGRAEDVLVALEFVSGDLAFRAGYRVLEGGADNDRVYNFAWLNHAVVGMRYAL